MQGPVQVQQPPLMYGYGNRAAGMPNANDQAAPGQGPPVLKLRPPHRAAATALNSLGPKMMMRPPNLAAGQPARLPSPRQQQPPPETEEAYRNRVYARLISEMKLQKAKQDSAAREGQQQISQTASAKPARQQAPTTRVEIALWEAKPLFLPLCFRRLTAAATS
jgi:hypothetical protein